jgi:hypothetical protein
LPLYQNSKFVVIEDLDIYSFYEKDSLIEEVENEKMTRT